MRYKDKLIPLLLLDSFSAASCKQYAIKVTDMG